MPVVSWRRSSIVSRCGARSKARKACGFPSSCGTRWRGSPAWPGSTRRRRRWVQVHADQASHASTRVSRRNAGEASTRGSSEAARVRATPGGIVGGSGYAREALRRGYPISTGVVEGACRHLIARRMEVSGAPGRCRAQKPS